MLVSYDFNILYLSGQIDLKSIWPNIKSASPFKKYISNAVCSLFNSGRWNELKKSAFLTVKYHNPENSVFQHLPVKENLKTHIKTIDWKRLIE